MIDMREGKGREAQAQALKVDRIGRDGGGTGGPAKVAERPGHFPRRLRFQPSRLDFGKDYSYVRYKQKRFRL